MKKNVKQDIYRHIMSNISKDLKNVLNENDYGFYDETDAMFDRETVELSNKIENVESDTISTISNINDLLKNNIDDVNIVNNIKKLLITVFDNYIFLLNKANSSWFKSKRKKICDLLINTSKVTRNMLK